MNKPSEIQVELEAQIPKEMASDFLSKLYYVSEGIDSFKFIDDDRKKLVVKLKNGNQTSASIIISRVREVAKKMSESFRGDEKKIIAKGKHVPIFNLDPHPVLFEKNELFEYGSGRYGLGPLLVKLMHCFDFHALEIAEKFSAPQFQFPSLIGADTLSKCKYLKSFPHSLNLVSHLREDLEAIQNFSESVQCDEKGFHYDKNSISNAECLLSPSVCFHYYAWLAQKNLPQPVTITALGKCFRYESGNLKGLERLWDFTMREIIFVGSKDYVLSQKQKSIDMSVELLDRLGLSFQIENATDPFFINDFATQSTFQNAFDLKFEIRCGLPYKQNTLAAGSFNYHQDFFGKSYEIKMPDGKSAHTGCLGFGLERLALAFLAQYGFEEKKWPDLVRTGIQEHG